MSEQKQILPVWQVSSMRLVPDAELPLVKSHRDAIARTLDLAGRKRFAISDECNISTSTLSQVTGRGGNKHLPDDDRAEQLYRACRNIFYLQWQAWRLGYRVVPRDFTEEERLSAELAQAQARVAELEQRVSA